MGRNARNRIGGFRGIGPSAPGVGSRRRSGISRRGFLGGVAAGMAGAALTGSGAVRAEEPPGYDSTVYPTGDARVEPSDSLPDGQRYTRVYSIDSLEVQAAVKGGTPYENWDVQIEEYNEETGAWDIVDDVEYPDYFPEPGNDYGPGGGRILLKSHKQGETVPTPFRFPDPPIPEGFEIPYWSVQVCQDCEIEGEIREDYYTGGPLAGQKKMTEIHNGYGFCANWWLSFIFGSNVPSCFTTTKFHLRNLVSRDSKTFFAVGYSAADFSSGYVRHILEEMVVENVKILDLVPLMEGDGCLPILFENDYGKAVVKDCYIQGYSDFDPDNPEETGWTFMSGITTTNSVTGPPYQPGVGPSLLVDNCQIDMDSSHLGSTGIYAGAAMDVTVKNSTVKADIAFDIGYVGWAGNGFVDISDNPGCIARHGGFSLMNLEGTRLKLIEGNFRHPGVDISIKDNEVHMDDAGSIDWFHYPTAVLYGQDVHFFELFGEEPLKSMKNAVVQDNTFTGIADFGIFMGDFSSENDGYGNRFIGNDYSGLQSNAIPIYLGMYTKNNLLAESLFAEGTMCDNILDETMLVTPMGKNRYSPPWQRACKTAKQNALAMVDMIHAEHAQRMQERLAILQERTGKDFPNWPFKPPAE